MDANAKAYEELSKPQTEQGCEYVSELNIPGGAKVLDMGCGTGLVTKYIADIVGSVGVVVGIDPDAERIKIAKKKYKDISHLQFHVGDSVTGFPHDDEPYYDFHVSTHAFHWFPPDQKKLYLQKTYQSLKPGGKLAILCSDNEFPERNKQYEAMALYPLSENELRKLFKRWMKASSHDLDDIAPDLLKALMDKRATFHNDGSLTMDMKVNSTIASKE